MANYATYPTKTMRITQNYNGTTSHKPHTTGNPKDYPFDEGCTDAGRDWLYCPCDEMVVKRIYGVGTSGTNTLWLESTSKVDFANGKSDILSMSATHPNDDDLKNLKVGQKFKRGDKICREGSDGATGNHLHLSFGIGKLTGNGWTQNSNGKWVLTTTGGAAKPEDILYLDKSFTKVVDAKGLNFKELPKTTTESTSTASTKTSATKYTIGDYEVTADLVNVRSGAGTNYAIKTFSQLSTSAQTKIKNLNKGKSANGYVNGLTFTVSQVKEANGYHWGKTPSGWVALEYCKVFKETTATAKASYTTGNYQVTATLLNVRSGAGTSYAAKKFSQLTADAQKKIKAKNNNKAADGYVKDLTFTVTEVKGNWGKTPSGWVCLDYCKKIK